MPAVEIGRTYVKIGDVILDSHEPDPAYIAEHGVTVTPGSNGQLTTLTVTFLVGEVTIRPDAAEHVKVENAN